MKLKDLMAKLATLNPEAEVYVYGGGGEIGPFPLESIERLKRQSEAPGTWRPGELINTGEWAAPSDTLIVLSE